MSGRTAAPTAFPARLPVILTAAPALDVERARNMIDAMLAWTIARHGIWFWTGLQGDRTFRAY